MSDFKVPFAYDELGNIIDRTTAQKGVIYKCNCGADVKLRGGDVIQDHFYHIGETVCNTESFIHKAYKQVFQKIKKIRFPHLSGGIDFIEFDYVELEKKFINFIPDAIGYSNGVPYFVEFAKSSYITEAKEKKIKDANVFCIEISIIDNVKDLAQIEEHLAEKTYYKHIIHDPNNTEIISLKEKVKELELSLAKEKALKKEGDKIISELNIKLSNTLSEDNFEEVPPFPMYFKMICQNGARMYEKKTGRNSRIYCFVKDQSIRVFFDKTPIYTIKSHALDI